MSNQRFMIAIINIIVSTIALKEPLDDPYNFRSQVRVARHAIPREVILKLTQSTAGSIEIPSASKTDP